MFNIETKNILIKDSRPKGREKAILMKFIRTLIEEHKWFAVNPLSTNGWEVLVSEEDYNHCYSLYKSIYKCCTQLGFDNPIFIFLDDLRKNPLNFTLCRTAEEAIQLIDTGRVFYISFDHDLGPGKDGYDVAKHIEEKVYNQEILCPYWDIHSGNPVGRDNIKAAMIAAERFDKKIRRSL